MSLIAQENIVSTPGVRGGRPRIAGRRITVDDILIMHLRLGETVDEIVAAYGLEYAQVYSALAYYHHHREAIDGRIVEDYTYVEAFTRDNPSPLQEILGKFAAA